MRLHSGIRAGAPVRALAIAGLALLLAGCLATTGRAPTAQDDDTTMAASPDNVASLTDVVRRNPNDPQAYNVRGTVFARGGRHQEALADFNKALALDPNYAQAYANRGLVYRQTKRYDAALADYARAIEIDANY